MCCEAEHLFVGRRESLCEAGMLVVKLGGQSFHFRRIRVGVPAAMRGAAVNVAPHPVPQPLSRLILSLSGSELESVEVDGRGSKGLGRAKAERRDGQRKGLTEGRRSHERCEALKIQRV